MNAAEKASKPAPRVQKPKTAADNSATPPIVPPGRGEITEPVPFDGSVSTVQEQPPHPRPPLHPGVVNNPDATVAAHHQVAVSIATAQTAQIAAIAASQVAGLPIVEAAAEVNVPGLEAKGEIERPP